MKKPLNNKGYMLIEIVLAFAIAMAVMYFITDLTIKLKNKNDDLLVKTLVSTDQAIIYNTIMEDLYNKTSTFNCSDISISGNVFKYKGFTNIISEYASIDYNPSSDCSYDTSTRVVTVNIGLNVEQLSDNFDVNINMVKPS